MHTLTQPYPLSQGTIIGNPLYSPIWPLLEWREENMSDSDMRTRLYTLPQEISEQRATPWFDNFYDFFWSFDYWEGVTRIGVWVKESVLRLLPVDDSQEALDDFAIAEDVIPKAIERWYISECSYGKAIEKVIEIIRNNNISQTAEFSTYMTKQLEEVWWMLNNLWLLDTSVYQIRKEADANVVAFPRDYFNKPLEDEGFVIGHFIEGLLGWVPWWPILDPIPVKK